MSGELLALAARVEAYDPRASLDNRADEMPLDLAIAKAVGMADADWQVARGSVTGYFSGDGVGGFGNPTVLRYTRSIDDAMALVPAGHWPEGSLGTYLDRKSAIEIHAPCTYDPLGRAWAATPALAIAAASLRARATLSAEQVSA